MSSIHLKIEQPEAVSMKKNILFLEKDLLETSKHIKSYNALRKQEFVFKNRLKRDFGILINLITSMEAELPREEVELMVKKIHRESPKIEKQINKRVVEEKKSTIEQQINEIREKLAQLG